MNDCELKQSFKIDYSYSVLFTRDVFSRENTILRNVLKRAGDGPHKVLLAIDSGVIESNPDLIKQIESYFKFHHSFMQLAKNHLVVKGGEICKMAPMEVQQLYDLVAEESICRHSFILAIGGGAVLDAVGFAAATAHRGVKLIRMPSTVLAQNDAGVGVKNAINHDKRKNFVGCFAPPFSVINDFSLLDSLIDRDKRAGIAEAIKVALVRDKSFFEKMYVERNDLAAFKEASMQSMIIRCAELHLEHISHGGDPFEQGSARPLDFGHWMAHKLEEMTHSTVRHGEAVAMGVMLDSLYSWRIGKLDIESVYKIYELIHDLGFSLYHYELDNFNVAAALQEFREHLGGELCITLLHEIGAGVEYSEINELLMQECVHNLADLQAGKTAEVFDLSFSDTLRFSKVI